MLLESPAPCDAKAARDFHTSLSGATIAYRENRAAVVTIILFEGSPGDGYASHPSESIYGILGARVLVDG
jgi:hypothetical protein